jgi:hypothetical protein
VESVVPVAESRSSGPGPARVVVGFRAPRRGLLEIVTGEDEIG